MKIACDVDGVLANFTKGYNTLLANIAGEDKAPASTVESPPEWNWDVPVYGPDVVKEAWKRIESSDHFWMSLESLPGAYEALYKLRMPRHTGKHDIYFLTHRMGKHAKLQTEYWLDDYGFGDGATVLLVGDKVPVLKALEIEAFIDDKPTTLEAVSTQLPDIKLYRPDWRYNAGCPGKVVKSVYAMLEDLKLWA